MASEGSVFQRADKKWCGKWKDADGKWRYLYRKTKAEAKQALREALKDRDDGIIPADKLTLNDALDKWLEGTKDSVSLRTYVSREGLVRVHIKPHAVGSKRLVKLTPDDLRSFYRTKVAEGLAPSTVKRIHVTIKQTCNAALRSKYIRTNPADEVKLPSVKTRAMDVLTPEQVNRLLDTARGDRLECVYVLGAVCALRIGEALSMRYEDLDLVEGTVSIRRTLWKNKTYAPKTEASEATIKIPARALDALRRHARKNGNPDEGWLFPTKNNNPVAAPNFHTQNWKPLLRKAGLPESLTFHQLRHGAASLLLNQGVPVPVVSKYLRHSNPGITMKVYAHIIDGTGGMAADAFDNAIGNGEQPRKGHLRAL